MMTLKDARALQKRNETKAIISFLIAFTAIGLLTAYMFSFTKILEHSSFYWLLPILAMMITVRTTKIYRFLSKKEFVGRVVHVHIYSLRERSRKGLGYGTGANSRRRRQEAEIIVQSDDGGSVMLTVKHQDTVAKLSDGDKLAILRFVDTPVIIEDLGKERSY